MAAPYRLTSLLFYSVGVAGLFLLSGCGTTASTTDSSALPESFPNHSVAEIQSRVAQGSDTVNRFSGTARVTLRSPGENRSVTARVQQRRSDSLFMRFSMFGIEGARLLLTPDSILYYDSRKNILRTGPIAAAQRALPAPVASGRVFENMLGLLRPDPSVDWTVEADSMRYYLEDPEGQVEITVDPTRWRIVRYARTRRDGTVLDERLFTEFRTVEGVLLPHRVIFRRPADDLMAMIRYQTIELNPSSLSLRLNLPSGVPRRPFR